MSTTVLKTIGLGIIFLFIIATGFWLSRSGKPYSSLTFNIHKLIALAAGVYLIVSIIRAAKTVALHPVEIAALSLTILFFVMLVATGGLLSILDGGGLAKASQAVRSAILLIHHSVPYLATLSALVTIYLVARNRM